MNLSISTLWNLAYGPRIELSWQEDIERDFPEEHEQPLTHAEVVELHELTMSDEEFEDYELELRLKRQ
jgi:hypothetical protein